jgi:NADPH2:quinone reductase
MMQRQGKYPPPPGASDIPGLEVAGTIVGSERRVCALVAGGGYAEYCVAPEVQCLPIPAGLDEIHAGAIPETFFTVWTNVFERGCLRSGESILVHGGTSGIGTTAIQLARAFGATVYATAGSDAKCKVCEELGAAVAINYRTQDFVTAIRNATSARGVDVILDIIGGDYLARNIECLAMDGRLVQIGLMGGSHAQINLRSVLQRRLTVTGSTLRPRTVDEKGALARELQRNVWPLLESGAVKPIISKVLPLEQAPEAHRLLESGEVVGKVVLTL